MNFKDHHVENSEKKSSLECTFAFLQQRKSSISDQVTLLEN